MMRRYKSHTAGFTLVELMVGMALGLIVIAIIMNTYLGFERQKRTTSAGTDAHQNGLVALHSVQTDARMAGFGLVLPNELACSSMIRYYNGTVDTVPLLPAQITDGGVGKSDSITFNYSDAPTGSNPAQMITAMPNSDASITMTAINMAGFRVNQDKFLIAMPSMSPGTGVSEPCTRLAYVDTTLATPSPTELALYNPPTGKNIFPTGALYNGYVGYSSFALNMGNFIQREYSVINNDFIATDVSDPDLVRSAIASNIVSIQAQYGVAPQNPNPGQPAPAVDCWTDAVGNACNPSSGDWAKPNTADIMRIKAIRVAIVSRSTQLEKSNTAGVECDATKAAPISWIGGPVIDLSANPKWQCHRYRTYQTIIPLRNVIWANL